MDVLLFYFGVELYRQFERQYLRLGCIFSAPVLVGVEDLF